MPDDGVSGGLARPPLPLRSSSSAPRAPAGRAASTSTRRRRGSRYLGRRGLARAERGAASASARAAREPARRHGRIRLVSSGTRSQLRNRQDVTERLREVVAQALVVPKARPGHRARPRRRGSRTSGGGRPRNEIGGRRGGTNDARPLLGRAFDFKPGYARTRPLAYPFGVETMDPRPPRLLSSEAPRVVDSDVPSGPDCPSKPLVDYTFLFNDTERYAAALLRSRLRY